LPCSLFYDLNGSSNHGCYCTLADGRSDFQINNCVRPHTVEVNRKTPLPLRVIRTVFNSAEPTARAVLRAALTELAHFDSNDLLQETLEQQALLPAALPGTPAFAQEKPAPFVTRILANL